MASRDFNSTLKVLPEMSFFSKFVEAHKVMLSLNAKLVLRQGDRKSPPWKWPLLDQVYQPITFLLIIVIFSTLWLILSSPTMQPLRMLTRTQVQDTFMKANVRANDTRDHTHNEAWAESLFQG